MNSSVFLDTSGLIALTDRDDYWHSKAKDVWAQILLDRRTMVTTSLVLIEIADGLAKVRFREVALKLVDALKASDSIEVVNVNPDIEGVGWELFRERSDKDWGMTDCVSFCVMRDRKLTQVFGLDRHFEQAGFQLLIND